MASTGPSYLTKNRFGIYYLQLRVPLHIRQNRPGCQKLIRKSLRTRNRREALRLARRLVVWMEQNKYEKLDEWEAQLRDEDMRLHVGLPIFHKLQQVEAAGDQVVIDEFMATISEPELEALQYAAEQHNHVVELCERLIGTDRFDKLPALRKNLGAIWHPSVDAFIATVKAPPLVSPSTVNTSPVPRSNHAAITPPSPTLKELLERWEKDAVTLMSPSSRMEYKRMARFFLRVMQERSSQPDLRVDELTHDMIRDYKAILKRMPQRVNTKKHSIEEIMQMEGKSLSPSTINNICGNVGHFLKWLEAEQYLKDPSLHALLTNNPKVKKRDKTKRVPLDDQDLTNFFYTDRYLNGDAKRASEYWAPIIALFTGCALGEIIQLEVSDIRKVDGTHVIDVNDEGDKQLKVEGSHDEEDGRPRLIPVHSTLKSLGFIQFVDARTKQGETRLFPCEPRDKDKKLFTNFSKRQGTYRRKHGIVPRTEKEKRDFHSFRHTVKTRLSDVEKSGGIIDAILGHTSQVRSTTGEIYNHSEQVALKVKTLRKLKYPELDFSRFRKWDESIFGKGIVRALNRSK